MTVNNLTEFFRESIKPYLVHIYTDLATKTQVIKDYVKPAGTSALAATDTVNEALGKLETSFDTVAQQGDSYTKSEDDNLLAMKADLEGGKVPLIQLPDSVVGAMEYVGVWDATTAAPANGEKGWYYKVSVAGNTDLNGITDWKVGDMVIWNGSEWDKIDNTQEAVSGDALVGPITTVTQAEADSDWSTVTGA